MNHIRQSVRQIMLAGVLGLTPGLASRAAAKPLQVYILAGQSNMQGHVNVSTFDSMAADPRTAPILKEMRGADGKPRVCRNVWISSIGCAGDDTTEQHGKLTAGFGASTEEIGPEFTFGIYMEKPGDPILIIKTSWGGKSLHTDFRSPGGGPYVFTETELTGRKNRGDDMAKERANVIKATGAYYRLMLGHVRKVLGDIKRVVPDYDPKLGYELAGFVWFQGFNDLVSDWTYTHQNQPDCYDLYATLMAHFIRDVRKDLVAPKMPFVIGVMGLNGMKPPQNELYFHQAQAAPASLPEFKGNVAAVETAPYWDDGLNALVIRRESRWSKVDAIVAAKARENPKLTGEELQAFKTRVEAEPFTPEEWKRLQGASNSGYHYLGAAKIMAPIGKAFAEAMVTLHDNHLKQPSL